MIEYILIGITIFLLFLSIKKAGLIPFPTFFIVLLALSEIIFTPTYYGHTTYDMVELFDYGGLTENFVLTLVIYTSIAVISMISLVGKFSFLRNFKIDAKVIERLTKKKYFIFTVYAFFILLSLHFLIFLSISDWDLLWYNTEYLSPVVDQRSLSLFGSVFTDTIARMTLLFAVLAPIGLYASLNLKKSFLAYGFLFFCIFYFLLEFALHSRSAAVITILIATLHYTMGRKFRRTIIFLLAILSIFSLICALESRNNEKHGFSSIPDTISDAFDHDVSDTSEMIITNFCQGIFSVAESLQVNDPFETRYKLLAFSPLPSFIDGYADILENQAHRLHLYVPMPGIGEVFNFGWPFVSLLIALYVTTIRLHSRLAATKPMLFLLCNFLIMFSLYHILTYPLRNGLRYLWFALFITLIAGIPKLTTNRISTPRLYL